MSEPQLDQRTVEKRKLAENNSFTGAFASVMILGVLIIVSWFGVWLLYLSR